MVQLQRVAIASEQIQGQQILLNREQLHYLIRVLRLKTGDRFIAIDARGGWWRSVLKENFGEILEPIAIATELPATITLIAAMPKGNGFEDIVRQTTELGVSGIYPVISDRTLLKPSPQKIQRWRRIAGEAAEQSERECVPTIFDPISFSDFLSQIPNSRLTSATVYTQVSRSPLAPLKKGGTGVKIPLKKGSQCGLGETPSRAPGVDLGGSDRDFCPQSNMCVHGSLTSGGEFSGSTQKYIQKYIHKYICVARGDAPHLLNTLTSNHLKLAEKPEILIATGPEGGWTPAEIEQATAAGVHPVSLGSRILRAITAPVVALSLIAACLESHHRS